MAEDPAINNASIGKVIVLHATTLFALLEREGMVVRWRLLEVPDGVRTTSSIEHAHLLVLAGRLGAIVVAELAGDHSLATVYADFMTTHD